MTKLATIADLIDIAAQNLTGVTVKTPLLFNQRLSEITGANIWLKREDLQPVRSYKLRGAYNLISQLDDDAKSRGVVCASAGNHGQGVAWSCNKLGIDGKVFIPSTTPRQKKDRMLALGGGHIELIEAGETYDQASRRSKEYCRVHNSVLVSAFDDERVIAGQGTVIKEVVEQLGKAPDVVLVPVGGGGLLSGVAAWLRTHYPKTRIIGVEPQGAPCFQEAIKIGKPVMLENIDTFIDGAAVGQAGDITYQIVTQANPEFVSVPEGEVCTEMLSMYQIDGVIAEPAGALASAALKTGPLDLDLGIKPGQSVVAILSGGNNDVSRYAEIVERSKVYEGRLRYFLVNFFQEPGALRQFLDSVLGPKDDIVRFEYVKRSNRDTGPALVGIELSDPLEYPDLMRRINSSPLNIEELSPDTPEYRILV